MPILRSQLTSGQRPRNRVELHLHLEGAARVSTIVELARKKNQRIHGYSSYPEVMDYLRMSAPSTLFEMLSRMTSYMPLFW